jgi:hypothetical protein
MQPVGDSPSPVSVSEIAKHLPQPTSEESSTGKSDWKQIIEKLTNET